MCLQFTFIHVLFAVLCFWSGFIAGAATNLIISVIAMGITLVMFQLAWSYTETGEVRLTKNMINKRFESFSFVRYTIFCFTFPILAGMMFQCPKDILNAIVITMDIGLFFLNFYIAMREIIRTNASEKIIQLIGRPKFEIGEDVQFCFDSLNISEETRKDARKLISRKCVVYAIYAYYCSDVPIDSIWVYQLKIDGYVIKQRIPEYLLRKNRKENDIYGDDAKPDEANSGNCEK